jgi:hypothetical protein
MSDDAPDPPGTAAERRLDEHLELLRHDEPGPGDMALVHRVVRTARWQRFLRAPIQVAASIAAAAIDGLRALMRPGDGSPR